MTGTDRINEVARILAEAILRERLRTFRPRRSTAESGRNRLDHVRGQRVHGEPSQDGERHEP